MGLGSAVLRREAAWVGAWEGGLSALLASHGFATAQSFRNAWPQWAARADRMDRELVSKTGSARREVAWEHFAASAAPKRQQAHAAKVYDAHVKAFHRTVSAEVSMAVKMASGPEAGAFLAHDGESVLIIDEHMRTAVRRRLGAAAPAGGSGVCHHRRSDRTICGVVCGSDHGDHAANCRVGGGVDRRHKQVRDALHGWLREIGVDSARTEQEVPRWNTPEQHARLDITLTDPRAGEVCVDVSLVNSVVAGAPRRPVLALECRERAKHVRYPGPGLFAFVLDVRGRWGKEAHSFCQSVLAVLPKEQRADAMVRCRRLVSRALQMAVAEQLLMAAARPPGIAPAVYGA